MGVDRWLEFHSRTPVDEELVRRVCGAFASRGGEFLGDEPLEEVLAEPLDRDGRWFDFRFDRHGTFRCAVSAFPGSPRLRVHVPNRAANLTFLSVVELGAAVFDAGEFAFGRLATEYEHFPGDELTAELWTSSSPVLYYGPELVADLGRERLLDAPGLASRAEPDGNVVLATAPSVHGSDVPFREYLTDEYAVAPCDTGRLPDGDVDADLPDDIFGLLSHLDGWGAEAAYDSLAGEGERAVSWLTDRLSADRPRVRASAAASLALLRRGKSSGTGHASVGTRTDDNPKYRAATAAAATLAGDGGEAGSTLSTLLSDADPKVRRAAAESLDADEANARASALFAMLTDDSSPAVRTAAACALRAVPDEEAIRRLGVALRDDSSPLVRAAAADALGRSFYDLDDGVLATVARRILRSDSEPRVRAAVLWMARHELPLPFVLDALETESGVVRETAVDIVAEGAATVRRTPDLRGADNFRENVRTHLDRVAALLADGDPVVQTTAVTALAVAATDDPETVDRLATRLAESSDRPTRGGLRQALRLASAERSTGRFGDYLGLGDEWPRDVGYRRRATTCRHRFR
ncbi:MULTISPECIES: HEAT repeat domain-containing protein [Halorussus]|uniref:HEAT repeat domain-containing protein n=1 Tax=Halorussus TaxID=1070314 RepID=UPI00209E9D67|nr:HEAT repeat domain-containing protein [Halorussus vallis]USZ73934.1 HEAT repeat domain-containing protein [Halorussus vallis]